jgi:hypothetical protein
MNNNYTKPTLRERIKSRIMNSNVGGTASGKWSARKSQILVKRYEEAGGNYKGKKNKTQRNLDKWNKSNWRTKSGEPSSKTGERYLPSKVIDKLSPQQYAATSRSKRSANKQGKQYSSYSPNLNRVMRSSGIY